MMSVTSMTEKELKAERDRLRFLLKNEELTVGEANRLQEILVALKTINSLRPNYRP